MADRGAWLKVLGLIVDTEEGIEIRSCPDCDKRQLNLRYVVDADSRIGYALFWCGGCLRGISVSRVRAPESMPTWSLDDPTAVADVPDFIRIG
ncbi:hypothetical protein ACFQ6V_05310 [Streptomyces roseifaciens]